MENFRRIAGFLILGIVIFLVYLFTQPSSPLKKAADIASFKSKINNCIPVERKNFSFEKAILDLNAVFDPLFDRANTISLIDMLTEGVKEGIDNNADPEVIMAEFNRFLFDKSNFVFDANANALLYEGSADGGFNADEFLNYQSIERVITRRKGICLSLSSLYLIIAERLKLPVFAVVVPGHIFVRYQDGRHSGINSETTFGGAEFYGYKGMTGTEFMDKDSALYNKILDNYTVLFAVLNNFSVLYSVENQFEKAEFLLKKSIEIAPEFPEAHDNLGVLYLEKGMYARAKDELKEAYRLFPGSSLTKLLLGIVYLQEKNYTLSEEFLNKAAVDKSTRAKAVMTLEKLRKERGK